MDVTTEVILCTYNGSAYIADQLRSILEQTSSINKISIYDDLSSDDTVAKIHEFVRQRPAQQQQLFNIQVNPANLGYALNFCQGIANATEDLLFLCDQDDIWEPEKTSALMQLFELHGVDMVFSDGKCVDVIGQPLDRKSVLESYGLCRDQIENFSAHAFDHLIKRNYINGAAAAIRRTAGQAALPLPGDMPHDYWLAIWCSLHNGIVATPKYLYQYRLHLNNAIGMGSDNWLYEWMGIWRQPTAPRDREFRIWQAVTQRLALPPSSKNFQLVQLKLSFLSLVSSNNENKLSRCLAILKFLTNGGYRKYSSNQGLLCDILSLLK